MATKWRRSKASAKIDYKNAKGVLHPCRCKTLWRVALWEKIGDPNAALLAAFQAEPSGTNLPGTSVIQWYTREPLNENAVNYAPPAGVCSPLFADGGTYQRTTYPASAARSSQTFTVVSAGDWKLENIYNEQYIVSYYLLEFDGSTTGTPNTAAMIAALPGTWTPFAASYGTGIIDLTEAIQCRPNQGTMYTNTYTGEADVVPVPTTTETNIAPNSPNTVNVTSLDEDQPGTGACTCTAPSGAGAFFACRHRKGRWNAVVLKFTDFKFFATLTLRCNVLRIDSTIVGAVAGKTYLALSTTQLTTWAQIAAATPRFTLNHNLGTVGTYLQHDISLTSNLLLNGRNLWLYFLPGPLVDGPAEGNIGAGGILVRNYLTDGYPTTGNPNAVLVKDIELIPTFTYGGTTP